MPPRMRVRKRGSPPESQAEVDPSRGACLTRVAAASDERSPVEPFPDLASLTDDDLKRLIDDLTKEEQEVSYRRRILHGKIDLLRAELQARLKQTGGKSVLEQVDVDRLAEILAGKAAPPAEE
jgi:hypothetical protein